MTRDPLFWGGLFVMLAALALAYGLGWLPHLVRP